ncbi:MAG TPA: hypothetical protein GX717_04080 [Clostridiaceae bacterium]|nr:hypothetical protein [Clostridiaceae bacterium]
MGDSLTGVECLTAVSDEVAHHKAEVLVELNQARRTQETEVLTAALALLSNQPELLHDPILVVHGEHWHAGILGIVATRLSQRFLRPCFVLTTDSDTTCHGSGRSFGDFDLIAAVQASAESLLHFGGHKQAVGLTLSATAVDDFRKTINQLVVTTYPDGIFPSRPVLHWDVMAMPGELTIPAIEAMDVLAPFGKENPEPQIYLSSCRVYTARTMGKDRSHLRLEVGNETDTITCVCFGRGYDMKHLPTGQLVSCLGTPNINEWQGTKTPQLLVKDLKIIASPDGDSGQTEAEKRDLPDVASPISPLPSKEALAKVYIWLREKLADGPAMLDPAYCCRYINERLQEPIGVTKLRDIIKIYTEAGIIDVSDLNENNCRIICVSIKHVAEKVDLYKTPTYMKLMEQS